MSDSLLLSSSISTSICWSIRLNSEVKSTVESSCPEEGVSSNPEGGVSSNPDGGFVVSGEGDEGKWNLSCLGVKGASFILVNVLSGAAVNGQKYLS